LAGVRLLAATLAICLWNFTFCAVVVIGLLGTGARLITARQTSCGRPVAVREVSALTATWPRLLSSGMDRTRLPSSSVSRK
jgi:hypothetical protein